MRSSQFLPFFLLPLSTLAAPLKSSPERPPLQRRGFGSPSIADLTIESLESPKQPGSPGTPSDKEPDVWKDWGHYYYSEKDISPPESPQKLEFFPLHPDDKAQVSSKWSWLPWYKHAEEEKPESKGSFHEDFKGSFHEGFKGSFKEDSHEEPKAGPDDESKKEAKAGPEDEHKDESKPESKPIRRRQWPRATFDGTSWQGLHQKNQVPAALDSLPENVDLAGLPQHPDDGLSLPTIQRVSPAEQHPYRKTRRATAPSAGFPRVKRMRPKLSDADEAAKASKPPGPDASSTATAPETASPRTILWGDSPRTVTPASTTSLSLHLLGSEKKKTQAAKAKQAEENQ